MQPEPVPLVVVHSAAADSPVVVVSRAVFSEKVG
jgi:hypothetical protein